MQARVLVVLSLGLFFGSGACHHEQLAGNGDDLGADTDGSVEMGCGGGCDGGVCVGNVCCAEANVCGTSCCGGEEVCLYATCVTPGKACHTEGDCPTGQYCESALGSSNDGGVSDGGTDGGSCTQPVPLEGRCLPAPVVCNGSQPADGGCLPPCEYHPPAGAPLNAVKRWQWGPTATAFPDFTDVWSTPTIGRIADANCDGKVDELDPPNVIFVAGNAMGGNTPRNNGVLRVLDGRTGAEVWSLDKIDASSTGFLASSIAIGDVDGDGRMDIVAVTGEKYVVLIDANGTVKRKSDQPIPEAIDGWGGGPAIADMDGDGFPEIAFGATVFSTNGGSLTLAWTGTSGKGGLKDDELLSTIADVDNAPDGHLELVTGKTTYKADGTILWDTNLPDGFPGLGDFDKDGMPEVVLVADGMVWILDGATGATKLGPALLPGAGNGGPPTVADFDGDGKPEIGVAEANFYTVLKADFVNGSLDEFWRMPNHDYSSSVTGSSVFDFDGDGRSEVVYGDECFLWIFDGPTGAVRFATSTTSFTATETSVVADVDGDGRAELLMISNGADPVKWHCQSATGTPSTVNGVTWVPGPGANQAYRGLTLFGDAARSWVGTRSLWNEHSYHVSNICDDRDDACPAPNVYGSIPQHETRNWTLPWLNNFRQNVQDHRLFDAPDATVTLAVACDDPPALTPTVRNLGLASLPAGVNVAVYLTTNGQHTLLGQGMTTHALAPGQGQAVPISYMGGATDSDTFVAEIVIDPNNPGFHECRSDNNTSDPATPMCIL